MILCDIGNTTFHFLDGNKEYKINIDDKLPLFTGQIYFISVNEKATKKFLSIYKNAINLKDIINFKTKYQGMGIDRVVACNSYDDGVIVDAGSAITVDVMKNGTHMGGFILPGLNAYKNIYPNISKKLKFDLDAQLNLDKIPLQTNDAINYAIFKSIILPISEIAKNEKIILTGGDALVFKRFFQNCEYKKYLIFDSMRGIINANNCIA